MFSAKSLRLKAMDLLARREHSRYELKLKLLRRGAEEALITSVLDQLVNDNLLSDERFAEAYVRSRVAKGYGPQRVSQELQLRGVDESIIETIVAEQEWLPCLRQLWKKRWSNPVVENLEERAKRWRFIQYRGYSWEQFQQVCEEYETINYP